MNSCSQSIEVGPLVEFLADTRAELLALTFEFSEALELDLEQVAVEDRSFVNSLVIFPQNLEGFHCYSLFLSLINFLCNDTNPRNQRF